MTQRLEDGCGSRGQVCKPDCVVIAAHAEVCAESEAAQQRSQCPLTQLGRNSRNRVFFTLGILIRLYQQGAYVIY